MTRLTIYGDFNCPFSALASARADVLLAAGGYEIDSRAPPATHGSCRIARSRLSARPPTSPPAPGSSPAGPTSSRSSPTARSRSRRSRRPSSRHPESSSSGGEIDDLEGDRGAVSAVRLRTARASRSRAASCARTGIPRSTSSRGLDVDRDATGTSSSTGPGGRQHRRALWGGGCRGPGPAAAHRRRRPGRARRGGAGARSGRRPHLPLIAGPPRRGRR